MLLAFPALAQDDGDGLFDVNDLFGDDSWQSAGRPPKWTPLAM